MFGLRKRVRECEQKIQTCTRATEQYNNQAYCGDTRGHKWRLAFCSGYMAEPSCFGFPAATLPDRMEFKCYWCGAKRYFGESDLPTPQRRELEYLGILAPDPLKSKCATLKRKKKGDPQ